MKRVLLLILALSLVLLCACAQASDPNIPATSVPTESTVQTSTPIAGMLNSAYPSGTGIEKQHPGAIALIKSGNLANQDAPTLEWSNSDSLPVHIVPRYTGSTVAVYRTTEDGFDDTPAFQTIAEDGCIISACLDDGERWYVEVVDHEENVQGAYLSTTEDDSFLIYLFVEPQRSDLYASIPVYTRNSALTSLDLQVLSLDTVCYIVREYDGTITASWLEDEAEGFYMIPTAVGSVVSLYEILGEENGEYIFAEEPTQTLIAEDGCALYAKLERPEGMPKWGLQISHSGTDTEYPLTAGAETQPELIESVNPVGPIMAAKPVIYLYPEAEIEVSVKLDYKGELTCTYPSYENGWTVTAQPDGTLTDSNGKVYNYLYWEGEGDAEYDFSQGFCVAGEDTAEFLETALEQLGLTRREANEFIVYWLPMMQNNPYNIISFQAETYTDYAPLEISPAPGTLIRVFMAWYPSERPVEITPQALTSSERTGFTVIEWGGSRCAE